MAEAAIKTKTWGTTSDGQTVALYTLHNQDLTVRLTDYGARLIGVDAPDREGVVEDVLLGHESVAGCEADTDTYFGAIVGRFGNRIAAGRFAIDGNTYSIPTNNHGNALHGGPVGFDRKVWTATVHPNGVTFTLVSPDGDMGFPGTLTVHVRYTLDGKSLHIAYSATTTQPTVLNLTNHAYFNLNGNGRGTILDEHLTIAADRYTPVRAGLIPTGELASVAGTPFDFRHTAAIGARIGDDHAQLQFGRGYDHNFVLNPDAAGIPVHVYNPKTGRTLAVSTSEPGVQFYSGNFLEGKIIGKGGLAYPQHAGFCLETQHYPDSPNQPAFPSTLLRPGETMHSTTTFTFDVKR